MDTFQLEDLRSARAGEQLSLFDEPCRRTMLCLPMLELHGDTFTRLVASYRPASVLDLRSHPYFERPALNREIAFEQFRKASATYVRKSLDLRPPKDQQALWRMRSEAIALFISDSDMSRGHGTIAVLIHRRIEIAVLEQALRDPAASTCWNVVDPLRTIDTVTSPVADEA